MRTQQKSEFHLEMFLTNSGLGTTIIDVPKKQIIFAQGDPANAVFYIQTGKVKLTVLSQRGKVATVALLGTEDFIGEDCVAAIQGLRMVTATAITDCSLLRIERKQMLHVLHQQHAFSDIFVSYLLARNARVQEDLIDQLFNSCEKRLARTLLLLANFGKKGTPEAGVLPLISQEFLAEMVGTTRSRINFFMNRFRKMGFIHYNGGLQVHNSLLNVILLDDTSSRSKAFQREHVEL
jgi:CRP/FNR family cyclic AMP-dependent transcriptional regulator